MKKKLLLAALFFSFVLNVSHGQKFGIAALAGVNLCQINGDNQRGYKKTGVTAGLRSIVNLEDRWQLHTEILFSQRGASPSDRRNISLNLNYVETPVYLSFLISDYESTGIFRVYAGASFGRLISFETTEIFNNPGSSMEGEILSLREISSYFNRNDFGIFAGVHLLPVNNKFGIDLRQTFSANLLFDKNEVDHFIKNDSMRSYFISLRFFYELNNIGDKKKKKRRR